MAGRVKYYYKMFTGEKMLKKKSIATALSVLMFLSMPAAFAESTAVTLAESIDWALQNNEQIKAADSGAEAAKWDLAKAKGASALSLNYSHTAAKIGGAYWQVFMVPDDPSSYFINTVAASVPLYSGGRIEHTIAQAKTGWQISELQVQTVRQQIRYQVTQAYYMILACRNLQQAKQEAVQQLQEHLKIVEQQFAVGTVAKADILRSEVALADAQQDLVTAANNTSLAISSFNKIVGRPIKDDVQIEEDMAYVPENYELDSCVEYALFHRPDRLAAQKGIDQAKDSIAIANSGKKPKLSFDALYATYDTKINEFDMKQWQVGLTASINIFDGNITAANVKVAKAKLEQAKHQENDNETSVEFEVQQAFLNMKKAESNIKTNQVAVAKAKEDFTLATARYEVNLGTNLDVVDAQVAMTNVKTAYIESLYDYNVSKAALEKAMGKE